MAGTKGATKEDTKAATQTRGGPTKGIKEDSQAKGHVEGDTRTRTRVSTNSNTNTSRGRGSSTDPSGTTTALTVLILEPVRRAEGVRGAQAAVWGLRAFAWRFAWPRASAISSARAFPPPSHSPSHSPRWGLSSEDGPALKLALREPHLEPV